MVYSYFGTDPGARLPCWLAIAPLPEQSSDPRSRLRRLRRRGSQPNNHSNLQKRPLILTRERIVYPGADAYRSMTTHRWFRPAKDRVYLTRTGAEKLLRTTHMGAVVVDNEHGSRWRERGRFRVVRRYATIRMSSDFRLINDSEIDDFLDALEGWHQKGQARPLALYRMKCEDPDYLHIGFASDDPDRNRRSYTRPIPPTFRPGDILGAGLTSGDRLIRASLRGASTRQGARSYTWPTGGGEPSRRSRSSRATRLE